MSLVYCIQFVYNSYIIKLIITLIILLSVDVNTVDISSNSELIASGSNDATVRIWKLTEDGTYKENDDQPFVSPITEHSYGVNCVRFSPFSTILATASTDGKIILWSIQTGKENFTLYHPSENAIRCLAFSPNSELLASGSDDETVCIWSLQFVFSHHSHQSTSLIARSLFLV